MADTMDRPETVTLYPNRLKWIGVLAGGLVFTGIGLFVMNADDGFMRWLVVGFFGFVAVAGAITLLPNAGFLKLDADGFTTRSMFRDSRTRWQDVGAFSTMSVRGNSFVTYDKGEDSMIAAVNRMVGDLSNALPDTYGMKAEELAALMERYRQAALKS